MVAIRLIIMFVAWTFGLLGGSFIRVFVVHQKYFPLASIDVGIAFLFAFFILRLLAIFSAPAHSKEELDNTYKYTRGFKYISSSAVYVLLVAVLAMSYYLGFDYHDVQTERTFLDYYGKEYGEFPRTMTVLSVPGYLNDAKVEGLVYIVNEMDARGIGADALFDSPDERLDSIQEIKNEFLQSYQPNTPRFILFLILVLTLSVIDLIFSRRKEYGKQVAMIDVGSVIKIGSTGAAGNEVNHV